MRAMRRTLFLLSLAACGGGAAPAPPPAPAPAAPAASASAAPAPANDDARRGEKIEALTSGEAKKGECTAEHRAALEKLLDGVESGLASSGVKTVGKKVLALSASPRGFETTVTGKGTEIHVLAYAAHELSLDVLVAGTPATTMRSPLQRDPAPPPLDIAGIGKVPELESDSRQIVIKPGQPIQAKLTGQGCAAVLTLMKSP